jgi:co-chaperonin GroES (HSP10)
MTDVAKLPVPMGYRLLVRMPEPDDTYNGLIVKASTTKQHDSVLSMTGEVVAMGESAYKDPDRFPSGPWCSTGDHVIFRANTGTRFKVGDTEYRLMNDDSIEAVVSDPSAIQRVN